ncbi:MAG TPA: ABC transporter permease [Planctomycetes bacterium]|nr:ABC transporter permease [Planctomycetota bacterium]
MPVFLRFLLKRFLWMLATLWVVFTVSFFLMRAIPGGPFASERNAPPEVEANLRKKYGIDRPLMEQYLHTGAMLLRGDFGPSFKMEDYTVGEVIAEGLPKSASLGILALWIALLLGLPAGILGAIHRGKLTDNLLMFLATAGIALPNFVIASILILLFVILLPVFPPGGWGGFSHLVLPAFCLGAPFAAYVARLTRTGMLEILGQDYIRTARAKGLSETKVIVRHALKGGLLPVVSFLGPAIAGILTGSLVIERIFFIPGLGTHFVQSAINRDYTLAMGCVLLFTALVYAMNFLVDICYTVLDPRVGLEG